MGNYHHRMPQRVTSITLLSLSGHLVLVFVICLHQVPNAVVLAQDGDGACDVPSVEPLASTSLTCHFNEDLNQTKRRFDVFLNKGVRQQNDQQVLGCQWISENIFCFVSPGYRFNNVVSRKVTLEIPRASVEHVGTYTCVTDSIQSNRRNSCDFRVKLAGKTMCDVPSVRLKTPTSLTCYFPEDISKTGADFTVYHYRNSGNPADKVLSYRRSKKSLSIIPGYDLDGEVTDHVTVRIPSATEEQEGKYSCHIAGVQFSENCSFTLERVSQTTSTCNISSVQETKPAELTCQLSVDANVTRKNLRVVRNGGKGVVIVSCLWVSNRLSCTTHPRHQMSRDFVFSITRSSRDQAGFYACHVLGSQSEGFESCELIVVTGTLRRNSLNEAARWPVPQRFAPVTNTVKVRINNLNSMLKIENCIIQTTMVLVVSETQPVECSCTAVYHQHMIDEKRCETGCKIKAASHTE